MRNSDCSDGAGSHRENSEFGSRSRCLNDRVAHPPDLGTEPDIGPVMPRTRGIAGNGLPFVAQSGRTMFFVADEPQGWVVVEMLFDPESCVFSVRQQSEYRWPREALGRLLSRVAVQGDVERAEADRMCDAFGEWLANRFAA